MADAPVRMALEVVGGVGLQAFFASIVAAASSIPPALVQVCCDAALAEQLRALGVHTRLTALQQNAVAETCGVQLLGAIDSECMHLQENSGSEASSQVVAPVGPNVAVILEPIRIKAEALFAILLQQRPRSRVVWCDGVSAWEVPRAWETATASAPLIWLPSRLEPLLAEADTPSAYRAVLRGEASRARDPILQLAAFALYACPPGPADCVTYSAALARTTAALEQGRAQDLFDRFVATTQQYATNVAGGRPSDILEVIAAQRVLDVMKSKSVYSQEDLIVQLEARHRTPTVPFAERIRASYPGAVMAEIKRASPSKGNIAVNLDPVAQAVAYADGGACVISVLTEPTWFKGALEDMQAVRQAMDTRTDRPAILCKDFIVDSYQIFQAKLYGADAILLIVAILSDDQLRNFLAIARELGMDALVEVANDTEMKRALDLSPTVVGINNRNLRDFTVDVGRTQRLLQTVVTKQPLVFCALSGIWHRLDVQRYQGAGVQAILVGEALMRAVSPKGKILSLRGLGDGDVLVKICGLPGPELAMAAISSGADFIGLVFAEKSKRYISPAQALAVTRTVRERYAATPPPLLLAPTLPAGTDAAASLRAWAIVLRRAVAHRPLVVGVFANQALAEVNAIAEQAQLDLIQLSGNNETVELAGSHVRPVIKAFHVGPETDGAVLVASVLRLVQQHGLAAVLLDTKHPQMLGGTGEAFDWRTLQAFHDQRVPFFLAGGLAAQNVGKAVQEAQPWAVDVSSGVEMLPGVGGGKDPVKMAAFLNSAKAPRS